MIIAMTNPMMIVGNILSPQSRGASPPRRPAPHARKKGGRSIKPALLLLLISLPLNVSKYLSQPLLRFLLLLGIWRRRWSKHLYAKCPRPDFALPGLRYDVLLRGEAATTYFTFTSAAHCAIKSPAIHNPCLAATSRTVHHILSTQMRTLPMFK